MEINLVEVDEPEALRFWETSPHATAFNKPAVAKRFSATVRWFVAMKGLAPYILWPVATDEKGIMATPGFSYYFGPMWSNEAWAKSITSRMSDAQNCYGALTEHLLNLFTSLEFELHPTNLDVRFFDWWNYGEEGLPRFSIEPRYSAVIENLESQSDELLLANMRKWRRIEVRRARSDPRYVLTDSVPPDVFLEIRRETFAGQGELESESERTSIDALFSMMESGEAFATGVVDTESGETVAANLTLDGGGVSNLVLSVLRSSHRSDGVGPLATYSAIGSARQRGMKTFDFNGANSPRRGDDKHSYGAQPQLYFRLRFPGK